MLKDYILYIILGGIIIVNGLFAVRFFIDYW